MCVGKEFLGKPHVNIFGSPKLLNINRNFLLKDPLLIQMEHQMIATLWLKIQQYYLMPFQFGKQSAARL